jgi:hypothetical protein
MILEILLWTLSSFVGSFIAILVVLHWDIEGWWEQRRLSHGKKLDQRQQEAAEKHGRRGSKTP